MRNATVGTLSGSDIEIVFSLRNREFHLAILIHQPNQVNQASLSNGSMGNHLQEKQLSSRCIGIPVNPKISAWQLPFFLNIKDHGSGALKLYLSNSHALQKLVFL